jgi:hypothetical protein
MNRKSDKTLTKKPNTDEQPARYTLRLVPRQDRQPKSSGWAVTRPAHPEAGTKHAPGDNDDDPGPSAA